MCTYPGQSGEEVGWTLWNVGVDRRELSRTERIEQNGETDSLRPIDRSKHTSPGVDEKKSEAIAIPADDEGRDQLARRNASPSPA